MMASRWLGFMLRLCGALVFVDHVIGLPVESSKASSQGGTNWTMALQLEMQQLDAKPGVKKKITLADGGHRAVTAAGAALSTAIADTRVPELACYVKQELASIFTADRRPPVMTPNATCAVVSSSGAMLHHGHGRDIDSHDVVVRFNAAPTKGYELHVGSKTGMRLGWSLGQFAHDASVYHWGKYKPGETKKKYVALLHQLYPRPGPGGFHPTTGFDGMMLALFYCKSIDAYEMTPSHFASSSKYSYFKKGGMKANQNTYHAFFDEEHDLYRRISKTPTIQIQQTGKASFTGLSSLECPNSISAPRFH